MQEINSVAVENSVPILINKRFENISWGAFLKLIGDILLVLIRWVSEDGWLIGAGVIMLGPNLARKPLEIGVSAFTLSLRKIIWFNRVFEVLHTNLPLLSILRMVIKGTFLKPHFDKSAVVEEDINEES